MPTKNTRTFVCGACGHVGPLPPGELTARFTCPSCNTTLKTGTKPQTSNAGLAWSLLSVALVVAAAGATYVMRFADANSLASIDGPAEPLPPALPAGLSEQHIAAETASRLAAALTPMDPTTRNTAVKIAARKEGPFHVEQVAEIWGAVREPWRYVNDPEGREYFATASETIDNGYVGDCDDFAITLSSMITAVGGKARIVLMDGPKGGHAYAEACVQGDPTKVAAALIRHYKARFKRYIVGTRPTEIAYRSSEDCPMWLNLDWNSNVPGGPYEPEKWAVAVYEGGRSENLSPAKPVTGAIDEASTVGRDSNAP
jgi:transglutaminase-like putative cysteine protease